MRIIICVLYHPKECSLKNLSEGSKWFECSLLPYVIVTFYWYYLGNRLTYCVVGGGWCVVGAWRVVFEWGVLGYGVFWRIVKKKLLT